MRMMKPLQEQEAVLLCSDPMKLLVGVQGVLVRLLTNSAR